MGARSWNDSNIWRVPGPASPSAAPGAAKKFIASTREGVDPRFSADGRRIAFASDRSGSMEIWVSDKNGQNITQLTSFGGPDVGSPQWSPDGHTIAFDCLDSTSRNARHVYLISANGGNPSRLTNRA